MTHAQTARHAANEKQRELREMTTRRATGSEMLASEARDFDRLLAETERELSKLEREADRLDAIQTAMERIPPMIGNVPYGWNVGLPGTRNRDDPAVLSPMERLADHVPGGRGGADDGFSLGRAVFGIATGRWDGAGP
jgi:hypothetical protein